MVDRLQPLHRLQLHDDQVLHQQIESMADPQGQSLVADGKRHLLPLLEPSQLQLLAQACPVDRLQQPWTDLAMDLDGRGDDLIGDHFGPGLGRRLAVPARRQPDAFVRLRAFVPSCFNSLKMIRLHQPATQIP